MLNRFTLLDLEAVAAPDALEWYPTVEADPRLLAELETPIEADKRLTDPKKIADDLAKKNAARAELPTRIADDLAKRTAALLESAVFDADACRIVCVGLREHDGSEYVTCVLSERQERAALEDVWQRVNQTTPMLGYGLTWYDAGVLVRRSQLLGVPVPAAFYRQGKYRHDMIIELADYLTLNGMIEQRKGRGLDYHCKRLGITVDDAHTGKDIAALWAAGDLDGITAHCQADITRIRLLAERLGVIPVAVPGLMTEAVL